MTIEQQHIAIAEALGWKSVRVVSRPGQDLRISGLHPEDLAETGGAWGYVTRVPDYLKDHNTRAEMLAVLKGRGLERHFVNNVCVLAAAPGDVPNGDGRRDEDMWNCLSVSQPVFAEAFLVTLNLWPEIEP